MKMLQSVCCLLPKNKFTLTNCACFLSIFCFLQDMICCSDGYCQEHDETRRGHCIKWFPDRPDVLQSFLVEPVFSGVLLLGGIEPFQEARL